jgi:glycosyltransferase involved in cell wall biosynthesis
MSIKCIISTGQGRLHLIQSAVAIKEQGAAVKVITGWIPGRLFSNGIVDTMGRLVGRKNLSYGLRKRTPEKLERTELRSCGFSEFYLQFLYMLTRKKWMEYDRAARIGWNSFCADSKKYINDSQIFHVRSGAGRAGAIQKARREGMKVVVDHSIAHPHELKAQLGKIYGQNDQSKYTNLGDDFWNLVLQDCYDADIVLVNSDYVKETFVERDFPAEKIRVVHLGIDNSFHSLKKNYDSNRIKLLFTGTFGIRKGALLIIEAARLLLEKNVPFDLHVIGNVANDVAIPDWFRDNAHITLHGHMSQDDMKRFLAESDIYIFPSYVEGAAQSAKEAMAAGLPVITTRNSGAPIIHLENGYLIPDDNAAALANAVITLNADQALRKHMGENASVTIRDEHTWSNYGKEVVAMYESLI